MRRLTGLLSALAHWAPPLAEAEWAPGFVFPLLRVFPHDDVLALEAATTLLCCWATPWFACFPQPPAPTLMAAQALLAAADPRLSEHLSRIGAGPVLWAWPLLKAMLTPVLRRAVWLRLMDGLVAAAAAHRLALLA
ncbi:unnamed protein product, partial [Phaeothamnion confervicola]